MFSSIRRVFGTALFASLFLPLFFHAEKPRQLNGFHYSDFKGLPAPSKELLDLLSREARWDDESGYLNPNNLSLHFVKVDEQAAPEGRVTTRYRVYAEGAPENKIFGFATWQLNQNLAYDAHDIYVNGQGLLMIHKPNSEQELSLSAPGDELVVAATVASAEPVRYLLSRRDGQLLISATLVPRPVLSEDKGCRLEARIAMPDASSVLIVVSGFPAKSQVPFVLESEGLVISQVLTTNLDGRAAVAVFPFVPGKAQGTLRASAEGPDCVPSVVLPWGLAAPSALNSPSTRPSVSLLSVHSPLSLMEAASEAGPFRIRRRS